jgi:hypothetical protein
MKKYFLLSLIFVLTGFLMLGCSKDPMSSAETAQTGTMGPINLSHTADNPFATDLIADGGDPSTAVVVGEVQVWNDVTNLYIKYVMNEEWCLTETHLHVATDPANFPLTKKGSPKIGNFQYEGMHECIDNFSYVVPLSEEWDDLYIAAHALVRLVEPVDYESDLPGFEAALPDQVTMSVQYPYGGGPAYFPVTTVSGGTVLDGTYLGWCVDTENVIYQNTSYTANVYSSYESLPDGTVDYPENLDLVNWIINQGFVGQPSSGCSGNYTYGDVQRAIWELIDDQVSTAGLGSWSQCRVNEILAAAYANGEGFVPDCGDVIVVILAPVNGQQVIIAQVTTIEVEVPCIPIYRFETAWGEGDEFTVGRDWSMYFMYTVQ